MHNILALVLLAAAPAAHADDLFALTGQTFPTIHKLDPATGAILESHPISGHEALFGGLAVSAAGRLFSIDGYNDGNPDRLFQIDATTGAGTVIGPIGFNWNFRCLSLNPVSGTVMGATDNALYSLDTATGLATFITNISGSPNLDQLTAIAISPTGQAFITDIGDTDLFTLDLQSGQVAWVASIGPGTWFNDLAFDSSGTLHGARDGGGVFTINTSTGALSSDFAGNFTGLVFVATPASCYPNCDGSTGSPLLTGNDFQCFLNRYVAGESYANCDNSTGSPALTANDFTCFLTSYVAGCS